MRAFILVLLLLPAIAFAQVEEPIEEPAPQGRAAQIPDISVIANVIGDFTSEKSITDRNNLNLEEIEIAFQSGVYPGVRADVIVAMEDADNHSATLEEGYLTISDLGPRGLGSHLGKLRAPFGKVNPIHPHHRPYADQPAVVTAFLGDHGLLISGGSLIYLFPSSRNYINLEAGRFRASGHSHEEHEEHDGEEEGHAEPGLGIDNQLSLARLLIGRPVGELGEMELGLSLLTGRSPDPVTEDDRSRVTLTGLDLTYRKWPSAFGRTLLRGEIMFHKTEPGDTRYGYYLLGAHKPDRYWEYGARYDWTEFPYPAEGTGRGVTAFATRFLNESTYVRGQAKRSSSPSTGSFAEVFLQVVWGIGPHSHQLQ